MSDYPDFIAAAELAVTLGEEADWPTTEGINDVLGLLGRARSEIALHRRIETHLRHELAALLGEGGAVHDTQTLYRYHRPRYRRLIDPDTLFQELGAKAARVFDPKGVRVTKLRGLLAQEGYDPETVATIEDTIFAWESADEATLSLTPLDRAPKWAQDLEPGVPR